MSGLFHRQGTIIMNIIGTLPGRAEYRYIQLLDRKYHVLEAYWSNELTHVFHDFEFGLYEVRVSDTLGRHEEVIIDFQATKKSVDIFSPGDRVPPLRSMDHLGSLLERPKSKSYVIMGGAKKKQLDLIIYLWELRNELWIKRERLNFNELLRVDRQYEIIFNDKKGNYGLEFRSPDEMRFGQSRFLIIPPTYCSVRFRLTSDWSFGSDFINVQVILKDAWAHAMVDFIRTGDFTRSTAFVSDEGALVIALKSVGSDFLTLLIAYYFLKKGYVEGFNRLARNTFPLLPYTSDRLALGAWLQLRDIHPQHSEKLSKILTQLDLTVSEGIPYLSQGILLIFEAISQLYELNFNGKTEKIFKTVGEWARHLVKDQPFTMLKNYRPVEFTGNWEPTDGIDRQEELLIPLLGK